MLASEYAARIDLSQNKPRARLFSSLGSIGKVNFDPALSNQTPEILLGHRIARVL